MPDNTHNIHILFVAKYQMYNQLTNFAQFVEHKLSHFYVLQN